MKKSSFLLYDYKTYFFNKIKNQNKHTHTHTINDILKKKKLKYFVLNSKFK